MILSDAVLRELVILEARSSQVLRAIDEIGTLLQLDIRAGSVSAMRKSMRRKSAKKKDLPAEDQPELPFREVERHDNPFE